MTKKGKRDDSVLPETLRDKRHYVTLQNAAPQNTQGMYSATAFDGLGYDNSFDLDHFKENFKIEVLKLTSDRIMFDMVGVDAPVANAFRRILLSEIPTMAIDKVYVQTNTSIIPDEVLAHRLGLVPILADPHRFEFVGEDGEATFNNTLVFRLEVECTKKKGAPEDGPENALYNNHSVYSKDLVWIPQGDQSNEFKDRPVAPVHPDILLAKLRPGQAIRVEVHAQKGTGATHAKWSPVCTASYRLLPAIRFHTPVTNKTAHDLKSLCPMNVFDIEDIGGVPQAVVARPRDCSMCRECVRLPEWEARVNLGKKRDHFIFSVESTGIVAPEQLVAEAIEIMMRKCRTVEAGLDAFRSATAVSTHPTGTDGDDDIDIDGDGDGDGDDDGGDGDGNKAAGENASDGDDAASDDDDDNDSDDGDASGGDAMDE